MQLYSLGQAPISHSDGNDRNNRKKEDYEHTWPWYPVSLVYWALPMAQFDVWSPTAVDKRGLTG